MASRLEAIARFLAIVQNKLSHCYLKLIQMSEDAIRNHQFTANEARSSAI